jgi:phage shock protein PspC (stress-responsive transcriptional regulator)
MKRLYRSRNEKVLAGVCGGIAEYYNIDPVIVRLIAVVLILFAGIPLLIYVAAIIIIPRAPLQESEPPAAAREKTMPEQELSPEAKAREKARMGEHVRILGILYLAFSALGIIAAVIVFTVLAGSGIISGNSDVIFITRILGIGISALLILLSLPGIIAGFGLLKQEPWARILALVLGVLNLINIPFGTLLGVYTIWVLTDREAQELFD